MSLFSYNGRAFQFRLVNLPDDVSEEIIKMILENGGEIVNNDGPLVINFTVPDNYIRGEVMYDVEFIKDCVKCEEIGDLYRYQLGPRKAYDGCITSMFLHVNPSCMSEYVSNRFNGNFICAVCGSRNTFEIFDLSDLAVPSQNSSDAQRVITSEISCKEKHPSQDKTEVSRQLRKLQTDDNASSQETSSIYETAEDTSNSSLGSNLSLMQATQDGIDELPTDPEGRPNIIITKQIKEIVQIELDNERSVKRAVNPAKHGLRHDTFQIIQISSDSESDVEVIEVVNTSVKEHESDTKDEATKGRSKIYSEEKESRRSNNAKNHGIRCSKALPSTSYAISDDDSDDVQEVTELKDNDKSRNKKDDNEGEHPTVSTPKLVEISDHSESSHHMKGKVESNNASRRPVRTELNINREKNGRPVHKDLNVKEWLALAKRKAKNMAAPPMRNFAAWEKWHMVIFLVENALIDHAKGLDAWKYMITREKFNHRTKLSLNNHFLKNILPHIEEFRLPKEIEKKFVNLRNIKEH